MKRYGVAITTLIASLLSFVFLVSASTPSASAAGLDDFVSMLRSGGLQATSAGALQHVGFAIGGQAIVVTKGTSQTQVELFEYADRASMLHDWRVLAGAPVSVAVQAPNLTGHLALNNANRILVFDDIALAGDQATTNDALVRSVGQAFLSLPTPSGVPASPNLVSPSHNAGTSPSPVYTERGPGGEVRAVSPPHTGDASLATGHRPLPLWAGLLWTGITASAIVFAAAGGLVVLMKVRRLA